jgi:hypothetical protein
MIWNWKRILGILVLILGIILSLNEFIRYSDIMYLFSENFYLIFGLVISITGLWLFISSINWKSKNVEVVVNILAILATICAALFGAYLGSLNAQNLLKEQNNAEQQNVANALYIEISTLQSEGVKLDIIQQYKDDIAHNKFTINAPDVPFYSDKGLYYSLQPEIASFNPLLSSQLYSFYNNIINADYFRNNVIEDLNTINRNSSTEMYTPPQYDFNESEIEHINNLFPWNNDEQVRLLVLQYYNPDFTYAQNEKYIDAAENSLAMKKLIIQADEEIPSLLYELNDVRSYQNSSETYSAKSVGSGFYTNYGGAGGISSISAPTIMEGPTAMPPAPTLISPQDGAAERNLKFGDNISLTWSPVPNAASYSVEIQYYDEKLSSWDDMGLTKVLNTGYDFPFVDVQPNFRWRWRVWAISMDGQIGEMSEWSKWQTLNTL